MPVFVHLASEKNLKKIVDNGIKAVNINNELGKGIYCMAVTQNFIISHQWLRELKRSGQKNIIGVYFKLRCDEIVWFGHYNRQHVKMTAAEAVKTIMCSGDKQGFEVIVPRTISQKEIYKTRHIPQIVGWRYYPGAHGRNLCLCPACSQKGTFKSTKIRQDRYLELISKLRAEKNELNIINILHQINSLVMNTYGKLGNVRDFDFLLEHTSERVIASLAYTVSQFGSQRALPFLLSLLTHENDDIKRSSAEGIMTLLKEKGFDYLDPYKGNGAIDEIINDYKDIYYGEEDE